MALIASFSFIFNNQQISKKHNTMRTQSLYFCLIFLVLATVSLNGQSAWTIGRTDSSSMTSYFESVDTIHYEPVLGIDGKTYLNAQEAVFSGIASWTKTEVLSYNKVEIEQPRISWIEFMEINGMQTENMSSEEGYQDQSNYIFDLFTGGSNYMFLNAEQVQDICEMKWKIWIDFNENHEFEKDELVFEGAGAQQEIQLQLPSIQQRELITRMRVAWAPEEATCGSNSLVVGSVKDVSVYIQ